MKMEEKDDCTTASTLANLCDEDFLTKCYESSVRVKCKGGEHVNDDCAIKVLNEEMGVLALAEKYQSQDVIDKMINVTRCALHNLGKTGLGSSESKCPDEEKEDVDIVDADGVTCPSEELNRLPVNVQLGVHMLLRIVDTLRVSENRVVLGALLKRLPNLLADLPPLALVEDVDIAREVYIQAELKMLNLGNEEELDCFQKRKAKIKRQQERNKNASVVCTASVGIPKIVSSILENSYQANSQLGNSVNRKEMPATPLTSNGDTLSALLGLSIKRGSLSTIINCVQKYLDHSASSMPVKLPQKGDGTLAMKEEEEQKGDDDEEKRHDASIVGNQNPTEDLDVEPYLEELATAKVCNALAPFQDFGVEQGGGILYTFGKGDHGKLGHGTCAEADPNPQPHLHEHCPDGNCTENIKTPKLVAVLSELKIKKVASLSTHSVAMTEDGTLYTWGNGDKNRLGHGTTAKEYYPKIVAALRHKPAVKDVSCGLGHTLALLVNGHVYAWGNGGNGRLGLGDTEDRTLACPITKFLTEPADDPYVQDQKLRSYQTPEEVRIEKLYCGASHSLAVTEDGRCFSWGKNNQGQCGHGDIADKLCPSLVKGLCKYVSKKTGRIIDESVESEHLDPDDAKDVHPDWRVKCIAGGWEHTLALTYDGRLFSFGSGYKDSRRSGLPPVLGHGGTERELYPRQILAIQHETIVQCACGWDHSLAVTNKGDVYTWGAGTNGKLGHGDEESKALPEKIESLATASMHIVQVEAGCEHSVGVTDDGYVYTWGHGDSGRLGHSTNRTEKRPRRVESLVERGLPVLSVAVGDKYNLILTEPSANDNTNNSTEEKQGGQANQSLEQKHAETKTNNPELETDLGKALLNLPSFQLPQEDDELVPEWMIQTDRVAIYTLLQLERLATGTIAHVQAYDNPEEDKSTSTKAAAAELDSIVLGELSTLIVPGIMESSTKTKGEPALSKPSQSLTRSSPLSVLRQQSKIVLPYCIETSTKSIRALVGLLKSCLQMAVRAEELLSTNETKSEYEECACSDPQGENCVARCSKCRWVLLWCTLRIIKANLVLLPREDERLDQNRQDVLNELHEVLLQIVDEQRLLNTSSSAPPQVGSCFALDARAQGEVILEAAATIQVGFTRFYPTSDSRLRLLRRLLSSSSVTNGNAKNQHSSTVLDVLMSNLSRDDAMKPLVHGMSQNDFDIYSLFMDLLGNVSHPSHLRLLLSFQTHAFTLWKQNEKIREVLVEYTCTVMGRLNKLLHAKNVTTECTVYLRSILPPLLCTLIVSKPIAEKVAHKVSTHAQELFETLCNISLESAGEATSLKLLAQLCGRLFCLGLIQFPEYKIHRVFAANPIFYFCEEDALLPTHEGLSTANIEAFPFPVQLALSKEDARETDLKFRQHLGLKEAVSASVLELQRALCSMKVQSLPTKERNAVEAAFSEKWVDNFNGIDLQHLYKDTIEVVEMFVKSLEDSFTLAKVNKSDLKKLLGDIVANSRVFILNGIKFPQDWSAQYLWGTMNHTQWYSAMKAENDNCEVSRCVHKALQSLEQSAKGARHAKMLRLLTLPFLEDMELIDSIKFRSSHSHVALKGLQRLTEMVKRANNQSLSRPLRESIISELLLHLPYSVTSASSGEGYGNPEAVRVNDADEGSEQAISYANLEIAPCVSSIAHAPTSDVISLICELIDIDHSGNSLTTMVSLLTNPNYFSGNSIDEVDTIKLVETLRQRHSRFYQNQGGGDVFTNKNGNSRQLLNSTLEYIWRGMYTLSLIAKKRNFTGCASKILEWISDELNRTVGAMHNLHQEEYLVDSALTTAAYLVPKLDSFAIPLNSSDNNNENGKHGNDNFALHEKTFLSGGLELLGSKEDDLDLAVDNVLLRECSFDGNFSNPLVPLDAISAKTMSVSFWLSVRESADQGPFCKAILSRSQRRDEDDGPSFCSHPWLSTCEVHSVVMHPMILLRKNEKGEMFLDFLVSTIILEDGQRSTLVEYASTKIDPLVKWFHVTTSIFTSSCGSGKHILCMYINGKESARTEMKGQVLRKCSSNVPVRVGGVNIGNDSALGPLEMCPGKACALSIFTSVLQHGAACRMSDLLWHSNALSSEQVETLFNAGRATTRALRQAAVERYSERLLSLTNCLTSLLPMEQCGKFPLYQILSLFSLSRWLELQRQILKLFGYLLNQNHAFVDKNIKETLLTTQTEAAKCSCPLSKFLTNLQNDKSEGTTNGVLIDYFVSLFERLWGNPETREENRYCSQCMNSTQPTNEDTTFASCFKMEQIGGYSPNLRSVVFEKYAYMLRYRTIARGRQEKLCRNLCEICSALPKDQPNSLSTKHRFSLQQELVNFFRGIMGSVKPSLSKSKDLFVVVNGGFVDSPAQGNTVLVPLHSEQNKNYYVGKVQAVYDASRILRTYCIQQRFNYLSCHASMFSSESKLGLYDFYVTEAAALVAIKIATLQGCFSENDEPLSPHSPTSPNGSKRNSNSKSQTVWTRYCSALVENSLECTEEQRQTWSKLDFDTFCLQSLKRGDSYRHGSDGVNLRKNLGPIGWNLLGVATVSTDDGDLIWASSAELCPVSDHKKVTDEEGLLSIVEGTIQTLSAMRPFETVDSNESKTSQNNALQSELVTWANNTHRRALGAFSVSLLNGLSVDTLFERNPSFVWDLLNVAVDDKALVAKAFSGQVGNFRSCSSTINNLQRFVSSNKALSPRVLEVVAERCWERVQSEAIEQNNLTVLTQRPQREPGVFRKLSSVEPKSANAPNKCKIQLESMGGDVQIDQDSFRVQGGGNFSSVRLRSSSMTSLGLLSLSEGKWYYEVTLMTDQLMQIGWADTAYRGDPINGHGVGDHVHSWAFDGYRGKVWNQTSSSYGIVYPWQIGDVVGCMIDMDNRVIEFSVNGSRLGQAFEGFNVLGGVFPAASFSMGQSARFVFSSFAYPPPPGYNSVLDAVQETDLGLSESLEEIETPPNDEYCSPVTPSTHLQEELAELESGMALLESASSNLLSSMESTTGHMPGDGVDGGNSENTVSSEMDDTSKRHRIIDALLATGLPMDWCTKAVEQVALANAADGSAFDENSAITWVMEEMMKGDDQSALIQSICGSGETAGRSPAANDIEAEEKQGQTDGDNGSPKHNVNRMLVEEVNGNLFSLSDGLPAALSSVDSVVLHSRRAIVQPGRSWVDPLRVGMDPGSSLSIDSLDPKGYLGKHAMAQVSENLLLKLVESCKPSELFTVCSFLDGALTVEYARAAMTAVFTKLESSPNLLKMFKDSIASQSRTSVLLLEFFRLSLFRGPSLFDFNCIVTKPLGIRNHTESALQRAIHMLVLNEKESGTVPTAKLESLLLEAALVHFKHGSSRPFDNVMWGSEDYALSRATTMSRLATDATLPTSWRSVRREDKVLITCAENGFRGPSHLMLSDADALAQPSIEWAVFILSILMNCAEQSTTSFERDENQLSVFSPKVFQILMKSAYTPNMALKDAVFRLCARILTHVRRIVLSSSSTLEWTRQYLSLIPEAMLLNLFTTRSRKEIPYLPTHTAYLKSVTALMVAHRRLKSSLNQFENLGLSDTIIQKRSADVAGKEIFISNVTHDSVTLKWSNAALIPEQEGPTNGKGQNSPDLEAEESNQSLTARNDDQQMELLSVSSQVSGPQLSSQMSFTDTRDEERDSHSRANSFSSIQSTDTATVVASPRAEPNCVVNGSVAEKYVIVIEYAMGVSSIQEQTFEDIEDSFDTFDVRGTVSEEAWKIAAEIPFENNTTEYCCTELFPDTPYKFRLGLRVTQAGKLLAAKTSWGPIRNIATELVPMLMLSPNACGPNLTLSNNNLTVKNTVNKKWNAVRAATGFTKGVHSWSVHIDKCVSKNIFVGVVGAGASVNNYVGSDRYGWGYLANKAVWHNKGKSRSYGELFREGDVVKVTLNLDEGTLSFARNGVDLGIGAEGVGECKELYPAVSLYNKNDQVTIVPESDSDMDHIYLNNSQPVLDASFGNTYTNQEDIVDDSISTPVHPASCVPAKMKNISARGTAYANARLGRLAEALDIIESLESRTNVEEVIPLPTKTVQRVAAYLRLWSEQQLCTTSNSERLEVFSGLSGTCESIPPTLIRKDAFVHSPWGQDCDSNEKAVLTSAGEGRILGIGNGRMFFKIPYVSVSTFLQAVEDLNASSHNRNLLERYGGFSPWVISEKPFSVAVPWNECTGPMVSATGKHSLGEKYDLLDETSEEKVGFQQLRAYSASSRDITEQASTTKRSNTLVGSELIEQKKESTSEPPPFNNLQALASRLAGWTQEGDQQLIEYLDCLCRMNQCSFRQLEYSQVVAPPTSNFPALAGVPVSALRERAALLIYLNLLLSRTWSLLEFGFPLVEDELVCEMDWKHLEKMRTLGLSSRLAWSPGQAVLGGCPRTVFLETKLSSFSFKAQARQIDVGPLSQSSTVSISSMEYPLTILEQLGKFDAKVSTLPNFEFSYENEIFEGREAVVLIIRFACVEALEKGLFTVPLEQPEEGSLRINGTLSRAQLELFAGFGRAMALALAFAVKLPEFLDIPAPLLDLLCGKDISVDEKSEDGFQMAVAHVRAGLTSIIPISSLYTIAGAQQLQKLLR